MAEFSKGIVTTLKKIRDLLEDVGRTSKTTTGDMKILAEAANALSKHIAMQRPLGQYLRALAEVGKQSTWTSQELVKLAKSLEYLYPRGDQERGLLMLRKYFQDIGGQAIFTSDDINYLRTAFIGLRKEAKFPIELPFNQMRAAIENLGKAINWTDHEHLQFINTLKRLEEQQRKMQAPGVGVSGLEAFPVTAEKVTPPIPGAKIPIHELMEMDEFLEQIPGKGVAIDNVITKLDKMGVSHTKLAKVYVDAAAGTTRWTANLEVEGRVIGKATVITGKYGEVLRSTQKVHRTFWGGVARDIVEVAKWGVAAAVIYAPMRKISEGFREAIEIQTKLADVQVALGNAQRNVNVIFKEASTIADELGVSVKGVVDGYVLAYRATGSLRTATERSTAAQALLRDSMILSKLSGMDQAKALDTLAGALRQTGLGLTEGKILLDKWVAVTRVANVDLQTLAESFAITSAAAENVGIDIDQLNGIIATVAEVTTLSATESGNAVRAFISGFQTDQAERELANYGIAVRTASGELRSFIDVIEDIVERRGLGLIDEADIAKLSEIIGGGARRGAQVNAFLNDYARANDIARASSEASGDSAEALGIKLETVQTALQRLNNAFTELMRTFSMEGGFLDGISSGVDLLTNIVKVITSLTRGLGRAIPMILAYVGAMKLMQKESVKAFMAQQFGTPGPGGQYAMWPAITGGLGGLRDAVRTRLTGGPSTYNLRQAIGYRIGQNVAGTTGLQALTGGLGAAMIAAPQLRGGPQQNLIAGGMTIAAGVLATALGGSPVWGFIGAQIANAILGDITVNITELESAILAAREGRWGGLTEQELETPEVRGEAATRLIREIFPVGGAIAEWGASELWRGQAERMMGAPPDTLSDERIQQYLQVLLLGGLAGISEEQFKQLGIEHLPDPGEMGLGNYLANALVEGAKDPEVRLRAKDLVDAMLKGIEDATDEADLSTPFNQLLKSVVDSYGGIAVEVYTQAETDIRREVSQGLAGVREMREFQQQRQGFPLQAAQILAGIGGMGPERLGVENLGQAMGVISDLLAGLSKEERQVFVNMAGDVEELYNKLEMLKGQDVPIRYLTQASGELAAAQRILAEAIQLTIEGQEYAAYQLPNVIAVSAEATISELEQIIEKAKRLSKAPLEDLELTDPEMQKVVDSWGELALQNVDTYGIIMQGITEVNAEVLQRLLEESNLAAKEIGMQFQQVELTPEQMPQLEAWMQYYEQKFMAHPGGAEFLAQQDVADILIMLSDKSFRQFEEYQIIFQLAMDELIRLNEEQLEGVFNLPEGMAAAIPWTGRLYFSTSPIAQPSPIVFPEVDANTLATEANTNALMANTEALGFEPGPYPLLPGMTAAPGFEGMEVTPYQTLEDVYGTGPTMQDFADMRQEMQQLFSTFLMIKDLEFLPGRLEGPPVEPYAMPGTFTAEQLSDPNFMAELNDLANFAREMLTGTTRPELTPLISPPEGPLAMPESIPITANLRFNATIPIFVDSTKIQEVLQDKLYTDFVNARRRTGVIGYVVES